MRSKKTNQQCNRRQRGPTAALRPTMRRPPEGFGAARRRAWRVNWHENRDIAFEGPPITFDGFSAAVHAAPHGLLNVVGTIHLLLEDEEAAGRYDGVIQRNAFVRAVFHAVWNPGTAGRAPVTALRTLHDVFSVFAELCSGNYDGDHAMGGALVVGITSLMEPRDGDTLCGMLFDIFDVDSRGALGVLELEQLFEWRATFRSAFEVDAPTYDSIQAAASRAAARMVADVGGYDRTVRIDAFAGWLTAALPAEKEPPPPPPLEFAPPVPPAFPRTAGSSAAQRARKRVPQRIAQRVADAVGTLQRGALALTDSIYQLVVDSAARGNSDGSVARASFVRRMVITAAAGVLRASAGRHAGRRVGDMGDGGVAALDEATLTAAFERVFVAFAKRIGVHPVVERLHADALLAGVTALGGASSASQLCDMLFDLYDPRGDGVLHATTLVVIFASRITFRDALDGGAHDAVTGDFIYFFDLIQPTFFILCESC